MVDKAQEPGTARSIRDRSLAYWSERAPEYSKLHEEELASKQGADLAAALAELPPARPGARVLDLGCGSGLLSIVLAGRGCQVTGVDFSADMLAQARANAERHGVADNVEFVQSDVHDLPFGGATFDLVVTRNVTWVLQDVARVYAEALRVLKPGGMFANIDANYGKAFRKAEEHGEVGPPPPPPPPPRSARPPHRGGPGPTPEGASRAQRHRARPVHQPCRTSAMGHRDPLEPRRLLRGMPPRLRSADCRRRQDGRCRRRARKRAVHARSGEIATAKAGWRAGKARPASAR